MQRLDTIKTIIFDFGGVLVNLDKQACINAFKNLGVTDIEKYVNEYSQSGLLLDLEKGLISAQEFRETIKQMSSKEITNEQIDTAWKAFLLDVPDYKLAFIRELRKKFRVVLLSNTNIIHMNFAKKQYFSKNGFSIDTYFDRCYLSYEIGMVKPSREIFEFILREERISGQECLFLDDGETNIQIASELGINTYWVKPSEDFRPLFECQDKMQ
jgi:putative hydrolase of the HAD superfamily